MPRPMTQSYKHSIAAQNSEDLLTPKYIVPLSSYILHALASRIHFRDCDKTCHSKPSGIDRYLSTSEDDDRYLQAHRYDFLLG